MSAGGPSRRRASCASAADGQPDEGDTAELRTFDDEAGVYGFLDLASVPPELREDRGEVEAARTGSLPALVTLEDLRGDLHSHSEWSDGVHTIEDMAEAARRRGYAYQVLTDHSQSLAIARGLEPERVELQRAIIAGLNARFAAEEAAGTLPDGAHPVASACCTAASWRSGPTAHWTTRTTCSPVSISWSRRCTSAGASRARSSRGARCTRSAARTWT